MKQVKFKVLYESRRLCVMVVQLGSDQDILDSKPTFAKVFLFNSSE